MPGFYIFSFAPFAFFAVENSFLVNGYFCLCGEH